MATDTRSVAVWLCGAFAKRSNLIRTLEDRLGWKQGYVMLKDHCRFDTVISDCAGGTQSGASTWVSAWPLLA
jgi:hypothetical protein